MSSFIDLICNDGSRVPVDRGALSECSPFFAGMFQMPTGEQELEGRPGREVQMTEDLETVQFLSDYLANKVSPSTSQTTATLVFKLLECADKYFIERLPPFLRVFVSLTWHVLAEDALSLFAVVEKASWTDLRWRAIRETLKLDIGEPRVMSRMTKLLPSQTWSNLIDVHDRRKVTLYRVLFTSFERYKQYSLASPSCVCGTPLSPGQIIRHYRAVAEVIQRIETRPLAEFLWAPDAWNDDAFTMTCQDCNQAFFDEEKVTRLLNDPFVVLELSVNM
ncbi:hypothetical protein SCHPADRAFT_1001329 [Schizopora paradoxa]|uniref:BTB domain-containing protein n=1 Tax=Schizopora paradoxa TaxID=27342 RepID=A0A0H2R8Y5_9AGAM|nr:hypothetical protein SCHPADRAFT_1001329 [Schizopora paradoxa]